jgi:hypothetical protein
MKFAVCAKFSGMMNDRMEYCPCDMTLGDVVNLLKRLGIEHDITDEGDSDYQYLGHENGETETDRILMRCRIADVGAEVGKFPFWLRWGAFVRDVSINAILDRDTFSALVDELGAWAEDVQTLGTLGGPLGGHMADLSFRMESQVLIESIRVTPLPEDKATGEPLAGFKVEERAGEIWERIRSATLSVYGS